MSQQAKQSFFEGFSDMIWRLFVSLKFTVVLLAMWVFGSVAGTVILQNGEPSKYVALYGTHWSNIMMKLGLFDVYHCQWYSLILLLLTLNIIACSLNTLQGKLALAYKQPKSGTVTGSGKNHVIHSINVPNSSDFQEDLKKALSGRFKTVTQTDLDDGGTRLYAHKQAYSHFMVYIVHLGMIGIIVGAVISGLFGFEGVMEIPNGESRNFALKKSGASYTRAPVGFTVRCEEFEFQRFDDGRPKDWYSTLTVVDGGKPVKTKKIEVNDPLSYNEYIFYQSSYVEMAPLKVTDKASGKSTIVNLREGQMVMLDELDLRIGLESFMAGRGSMSARVAIVTRASGTEFLVVSSDEARNAAMNKDKPVTIDFASKEPAYTTGLMVVADPGVNLVWFGSFLFILGLYLTFYSSHRRIMLEIRGNKLELKGLAQRNRIGFSREINGILEKAGVKMTNDK